MTTLNPFDFLSSSGNSGDGKSATTVLDPPKEPSATSPVVPEKPPAPAKAARAATKQLLYVDIETIPDESRAALFDLPAIPSPAEYIPENDGPCPSELLKGTIEDIKAAVAKTVAHKEGKQLPAVILAGCVKMERAAPKPRKGVIDFFDGMLSVITNEASTIQAAADANRKTMSVTPEMCRIVAIGFGVGSDPAMSLVVGQPTADGRGVNSEIDILNKFWELAGRFGGPIVGYNVLGFDLPAIFVRSILLDVKPTKKFDMKPWGADVVDLMKARFPAGPAKPLKSLAAWMGIPIPADGVDGSQVAGLFANDPVKLGDYVRSDITITRELHRKFRGTFCG